MVLSLGSFCLLAQMPSCVPGKLIHIEVSDIGSYHERETGTEL